MPTRNPDNISLLSAYKSLRSVHIPDHTGQVRTDEYAKKWEENRENNLQQVPINLARLALIIINHPKPEKFSIEFCDFRKNKKYLISPAIKTIDNKEVLIWQAREHKSENAEITEYTNEQISSGYTRFYANLRLSIGQSEFFHIFNSTSNTGLVTLNPNIHKLFQKYDPNQELLSAHPDLIPHPPTEPED